MSGGVKTALVIGATADIGRAIARKPADAGYALQLATRGAAAACRPASARWRASGGALRTTFTARPRRGSPRSCPDCATGRRVRRVRMRMTDGMDLPPLLTADPEEAAANREARV